MVKLAKFVSVICLASVLIALAGSVFAVTDIPSTGSFDFSNDAEDSFVSGNYLYLIDENDGLFIVDISNPANMELKGRSSFSSNQPKIYVEGAYAFISSSASSFYLKVIDISDPANPKPIGEFKDDGSSLNTSLIAKDNFVYLANESPNQGIRIIDVRQPTSPVLKEDISLFGKAEIIKGLDSMIAVAARYDISKVGGGLYLYRINQPGEVEKILYHKLNKFTGNPIEGLDISKKWLVVASEDSAVGSSKLFVSNRQNLDISVSKTLKDSTLIRDIAIKDDLVFVGYVKKADMFGKNMIAVYDLSDFNNGNIIELGAFEVLEWAYDVEISEDYLYVMHAESGVQLFKIADILAAFPSVVPNNPPVLSLVGGKSIEENGLLNFVVSATDPDGDDLFYSAGSLPMGALFFPDSQTFLWKPIVGQAGEYEVTFSVTDGEFVDSEMITITVFGLANRSPVLNPIGDQIIETGKELQFIISATDPDGDILDYSISGLLPQGAIFNSDTQTFSWVPISDQQGRHYIIFSVSDSTLSDSETIIVTVTRPAAPPSNNPPIASVSAQPISGEAPLIVSFSGSGTDTDGKIVSYFWDFGDGSDSSEQNPKHTYTVDGNYTVRFVVTDDDGVKGRAEINIIVSAPMPFSPINHPPTISPIGNKSVQENKLLDFFILANDPDGDVLTYSAIDLPRGAIFYSDQRRFAWNSSLGQAGEYEVTFSVTDGEFVDSETITIIVNPAPVPPPTKNCSDIGGKCYSKPCSDYQGCSTLVGDCFSGYCCEGDCVVVPVPAPTPSPIAPTKSGPPTQLELRYPKLPGLEPFESGQPLGYYIKYFLHLFFYIAAGVCVVAIIIGGFLYVSGMQRTTSIIKAREWIKRGLTGLFILLFSWLFLYVVNPQLLILKITKEPPEPGEKTATAPYKPNQAVFQEVPSLQVVSATLDKLGGKVYLDNQGRYIDAQGYLIDGYGNYVDSQGNLLEQGKKPIRGSSASQNFVFRAEIPLRSAAELLEQAIEIIEGVKDSKGNIIEPGLQELLQDCSCGMSNFYIAWDGINGKCEGGLKPETAKEMQDKIQQEGESIRTGKNICKTRCEAGGCGEQIDDNGFPVCDLREVRLSVQEITGGRILEMWQVLVENPAAVDGVEIKWKWFDWQAVGWDPPFPGWRPEDANKEFVKVKDGNDGDKVKPERLIKYKVLKLLEIRAQLEAQKQKFFPEQLDMVVKSLLNNKAQFSLRNAKQGLLSYDFADYKEQLEEMGYEVLIKPFLRADEGAASLFSQTGQFENKGLSKAALFLASIVPFVDAFNPFTDIGLEGAGSFYYLVHIPESGFLPPYPTAEASVRVFSSEVEGHNQEVRQDSFRFSLFQVLTDLTLEKLKEMVQDCLFKAFGKASYSFSEQQLTEVIQSAIDEGSADHFSAVLEDKVAEFNERAEQGIKQAADKDITLEIISRYINECRKNNGPCRSIGAKDEDIKEVLDDLNKGCNTFTACCPCVKNLKENSIPPQFVSNTITQILTADFIDYNETIKEKLNTSIRDILFEKGGKIDQFLDKEMLEIYNALFKGALTKSFSSIPTVRKLLDMQMQEILPDVVVDLVQGVDAFLSRTIEGECRQVAGPKECAQEVYSPAPKLGGGYIKQCCVPNTTQCRNVLTEYLCKKEVYREQGNKKECCVIGIKQWLQDHSEGFVRGLAEQYLIEPTHQLFQGIIASKGLSAEYLSLNECFNQEWPRRIFKFDGWSIEGLPVVSVNGERTLAPSAEISPETGEMIQSDSVVDAPLNITSNLNQKEPLHGKCVEITPEDINSMGAAYKRIPGREFFNPVSPDSNLKDAVGVKRQIEFLSLSKNDRENICHEAGYKWRCDRTITIQGTQAIEENPVWKGYDKEKNCRCDYVDDPLLEAQGALEAVKNPEKLAKSAGKAIMNYTEGFFIAIIETTLHTAIEYAKVFIEDNIIFPFQASFDKIVNFQKTMGGFLEMSVEEVLPDKIADTLNSNVDQQIQKICADYAKKKAIVVGEAKSQGKTQEEIDRLKVPITIAAIDLPEGITWDGSPIVEQEINISQEVGDVLCEIKEHLHSTTLEALVDDKAINVLHSTLLELIANKEVRGRTIEQWLSMNLADVLWQGRPGVLKFINSTPREIICGEVPIVTVQNGQMAVDINNTRSIAEKCLEIKKAQWGFLPAVDYGLAEQRYSKDDRKLLVPWCSFIYNACQNPFSLSSLLQKTMGQFIKESAEMLCLLADKETKEQVAINPNDLSRGQMPQCAGDCAGVCSRASANCAPDPFMKNDPNCPEYLKWTCQNCSWALRNSVAFSVFYDAVSQEFDLTKYDIVNGKYPAKLTVQDADLAKMKKDERDVYQWLLVYFKPELVSTIQDVALQRGFQASEWSELYGEVRNLTSLNNLADKNLDPEGVLMLLVSWRLGSAGFSGRTATFEQFVTSIPLGVIKSADPNKQPLLSSRSEQKNFLDKTPFQLVSYYFCSKIEKDFAKKYPNYTLQALARSDWQDLSNALPYSLEAVQTKSIAKRLEIIASASSAVIDPDLKSAYLFCNSLLLTPAEMLGLDQPLINYVEPEEYRILFSLMRDGLNPGRPSDCQSNEVFQSQGFRTECCRKDISRCRLVGDRPEMLNKILYYLYEFTPVEVLRSIKEDLIQEISLPKNIDKTEELQKKIDNIQRLIEILETPLAVQIQKTWPELGIRIVDYIFTRDELQSSFEGEFANKWSWYQTNFFLKTPIQIVAEKLTDKLIDPNKAPNIFSNDMSLMAQLSQNSVLGEKYVDTLGRWLNFDKALFGAKKVKEEVIDKWVQEGVNKGISVLQEAIEYTLIKAPKKIASAVARFFGKGIGSNLSKDIVGYCTDEITENGQPRKIQNEDDCREALGEIYRENEDGTKECCSLAEGLTCEGRCALVPESGCDELKGEKKQTAEDCQTNQEDIWCCYNVKNGQCQKARVINAQAGAKCRTAEDGTEIEKPGEIKVGNRKYGVCWRGEDLDKKDDACPTDDLCCVSVMDCIANKFAAHLEVVAEMLADGEIPLSDLRFQRREP